MCCRTFGLCMNESGYYFPMSLIKRCCFYYCVCVCVCVGGGGGGGHTNYIYSAEPAATLQLIVGVTYCGHALVHFII